MTLNSTVNVDRSVVWRNVSGLQGTFLKDELSLHLGDLSAFFSSLHLALTAKKLKQSCGGAALGAHAGGQ